MRIELLAFLFATAACQQTQAPTAAARAERAVPAPFDIEALLSDAEAYVSQRYEGARMPGALIADLTGADFTCQSRATMSECSHTRAAGGVCFDVTRVSIDANNAVTAARNRRCLGALPPQPQ
jgi:hypothetical protein